MHEYYEAEQIHQADGGIVTMGCDPLRDLLAEILTRVPASTVDSVFEKCIYLMPQLRERGCFIPNRVISGKHIILFPEELLSWPKDEQIYVVLHETAHYVLKHKSPLEDRNLDYQRQEREADAMVDKWFVAWSKGAKVE